jgi:DNA-dependent RNA polymerase auxiliary subunit epsilon
LDTKPLPASQVDWGLAKGCPMFPLAIYQRVLERSSRDEETSQQYQNAEQNNQAAKQPREETRSLYCSVNAITALPIDSNKYWIFSTFSGIGWISTWR